VFRHQIEQRGLESHFELIDSAGTAGYHVGSRPDGRSLAVLEQNGIKTSHRARQIHANDFVLFDYILCMDESNLSNCLDLAGKESSRAKGDLGNSLLLLSPSQQHY
jgi:low molecular weight phosphotyrosine protein phosphatase